MNNLCIVLKTVLKGLWYVIASPFYLGNSMTDAYVGPDMTVEWPNWFGEIECLSNFMDHVDYILRGFGLIIATCFVTVLGGMLEGFALLILGLICYLLWKIPLIIYIGLGILALSTILLILKKFIVWISHKKIKNEA